MYMLWSIEFISLCAKPDRTHVLCTWVLWVFAWASKPRVDINLLGSIWIFVMILCSLWITHRPVGRGIRGGTLEPPFWPPKDFIYTAQLYILSVLPFEIGPVAWMLLRITAVHTTSSECARISCLRRCDEGRNVTISAAQEFTNCLLVMSPHLLFCQP